MNSAGHVDVTFSPYRYDIANCFPYTSNTVWGGTKNLTAILRHLRALAASDGGKADFTKNLCASPFSTVQRPVEWHHFQ